MGHRGRLLKPVLEILSERTQRPYDAQKSGRETPEAPAAPSDQAVVEEGITVYESLEESQLARANEARARITKIHEGERQPAEA